MSLAEITQCKIHPAIGIARVGGSKDTYFIGPEIPGKAATPPDGGNGGYKDAHGLIARQVARFRIYGYNSQGEVVAELTAENAGISWTVHLANTKAAWYNFQIAMDIPEAKKGTDGKPLKVPRRNANVVGADRKKLVIDPGPRTVTGKSKQGSEYEMGSGKFWDVAVPLGELRTDEDGRLLVFGGLGVSGARYPLAIAKTFANNDNWFDDTSDGPVTASVNIGGKELPVTPSWVVVAPADYAPGINAVVTMYDVISEVASVAGGSSPPNPPSFTEHIYPIFENHTKNQWVNAGFARDFGWGQPYDFTSEEMIQSLADKSDAAKAFRSSLFHRIRNPDYKNMEPGKLPPMYGDGMSIPAADPRQWLAVTKLQYSMLRQWANGDFLSDWPAGGLQLPRDFSDIPLSGQPAALDKAALEACLGGPFHPGCEMTWPMRVKELYDGPFRIKHREETAPDYGPHLTSEIALKKGGPLDGSQPGDITRWMAVPWQTDTSSCLYAYVGWQSDVYLPTFWPARVPNNLLTQDQYDIIMDADKPLSEREEALAYYNRRYWLRNLPPRFDYLSSINAFLNLWQQLGIAVERVGPGDQHFPKSMHVETGNEFVLPGAPEILETEDTTALPIWEILPNPRLFR